MKSKSLAIFSARLFNKNLLLLVALSLFISCGKSAKNKESKSAETLVDDYTLITSCEFDSRLGDGYGFTSSNINSNHYFNKKWDESWLTNVLSSSLENTYFYALSRGVNIYAVEVKEDGCNFDLPPSAPKELSEKFIKVSGDKSEVSLLGLYLTKNANLTHPTILIKRKTDRWTLVHELMHHNFASHRKNIESDELLKQIETNIEILDRLDGKIVTVRDWNQFFDATLSLAEYSLVYTMEYPLEEVTIEHKLIQSYLNGSLKFVSSLAFKNAKLYKKSSLQKALDFNVLIQKELNRIFLENSKSVPEVLKSERRGRYRELLNAAFGDLKEITESVASDIANEKINEENQKRFELFAVSTGNSSDHQFPGQSIDKEQVYCQHGPNQEKLKRIMQKIASLRP